MRWRARRSGKCAPTCAEGTGMAKITPRPEFGRPETGLIRHWFRTDAQMRRNYLSPEERELERQRIGERRRLAKEWRASAERDRIRNEHGHFACNECSAGLHDVGIYDGHEEKRIPPTVELRLCCTCLRTVTIGPAGTRQLRRGPNFSMLRCRVLDPDMPEREAEVELA